MVFPTFSHRSTRNQNYPGLAILEKYDRPLVPLVPLVYLLYLLPECPKSVCCLIAALA